MDLDDEAIFRTFVEESEEGLSAIEESILALETDADGGEALSAMFRAAHTLKGNALNLDLHDVAELAHALEDVLGRLREGTLEMLEHVATLLLHTVDLLRAMVPQGAAASTTPAHAEALRRLRRLAAGGERGPAPLDAASPEDAAPASAHPAYDSRGRTVRVNIETLDRLLDLTGEIAVARARVGQALEREGSVRAAFEAHQEAQRLHTDLQELVMRARMVALGPTFRAYRRTVRDVAALLAREARLDIEGEDVEVDARVAEHLRDPLTHIVRNALAHGIEPPEVRRARGKDPCGRITLSARHEAGRIVIEARDDGAGLDRAKILAQAARLGLRAESTEAPSEGEIHELLFAPGFSTAAAVTELSGRGVGLDVVRRNVEAVRGTISLSSVEGVGTTVTLRLPLTVAIVPGFAVGVGEETYLVPLDAVVECLELPPEESRNRRPAGVLSLRGQPMPYLRLRDQLGCTGSPPDREHVLVVHHEGGRTGLAVDSLLGESQAVLKPLGRLVGDVVGIAGAAVLGGGRVGLVLDVAGLVHEGARAAGEPRPFAERV